MNSKHMYIFVPLGIVLLYGAYNVFLFWNAAQKSAPLIAATSPYNREVARFSKSILVLGDSLAVGVGAPGEMTVAGRLAKKLDANVANFAKSGAHTKDLEGQMAAAQKSQYDLVLIQAGANDIIQLKSLAAAEANMDKVLQMAKLKSDHVVFLIAGNVGDAPLWPWPWGRIYTSRTLDLRARYTVLAQKHGALFIDLYARGNLFASDPNRYYANDQLHLSADGYEKWFDVIAEEAEKRWPELVR